MNITVLPEYIFKIVTFFKVIRPKIYSTTFSLIIFSIELTCNKSPLISSKSKVVRANNSLHKNDPLDVLEAV